MPSIIRTENLSKHFGSVAALDEINIKCEEGITAVLGPNGAGKTTFIKILLNLIKPTSGNAFVFELDAQRQPEQVHWKVGVLHEKPIYPKHFTAEQFLKLVCKFYNVVDAGSQIDRVIDLVGIDEHRYRPIGHYSAGMVQRLGIAQTLVVRPQLIILDEPMANLDPISRLKILQIVEETWKKHKVSFLILSHDLYYLEKICSSAFFIKSGQIVLSGHLKNLLKTTGTSLVKIKFKQASNTDLESITGFSSVEELQQIARSTYQCRVTDLSDFQTNLLAFASEKKLIIDSYTVQYEDLESLYYRLMNS